MNLFEWKYNVWLFVGVMLACFAVSVWVRYQQFETWKRTPAAYFVGERPLMTTSLYSRANRNQYGASRVVISGRSSTKYTVGTFFQVSNCW